MSKSRGKVGLRQPVLKSPLSHTGFGRSDIRRPESSHDPNTIRIYRDFVEQEAPTTYQVSEVNSEIKSNEITIMRVDKPTKTCESSPSPPAYSTAKAP